MPANKFESGYYWVKFEIAGEWEPAWVQFDVSDGSVQARSVMSNGPEILKPGRDVIGHKIEHEAPVVIPETKQLAEDAKVLLSFVPAWARSTEPDLHPTMYGTLDYEQDKIIVDQVKEIRERVEAALHGKEKEEGKT